jgi:2-(1,2-epoxy-1,2-dihydrophenyl)acetyl-CoA isomerase
MSELVLTAHEGPITTITLNRPERHNSLNPELLAELLDALVALRSAPHAGQGAVVLQANGRSFSTGGDAKGFVDNAENVGPYAYRIVGLLNQVILAMLDGPLPIVAAVHGIVTGGSLGLVLASDIVLVAPEATFAPFYSVVGPSPDGGWATLLPQVIGHKRAAEVLFLNRPITADEAVAWGLANRVVPADRIRDAARAVALDIASRKSGSVRRTKRLLWGLDRFVAARLEEERQQFLEQIVTDEALNGFREFLAQRAAAKTAVNS